MIVGGMWKYGWQW